MKKTCGNSTMFLWFDDDNIKLLTEYNMQNVSNIHILFDLGIEFFIKNKMLESKREKNLIILKIKDFNSLS